MTQTPEILNPPPAGPPWMIQPGSPVELSPDHSVSPPAALRSPLATPTRHSLYALARAAFGGVFDSFRYLLGT